MSAPQKARPAKEKTREKVLKAAITVFADYPYDAASIRMIGKAAGVDHPLISYYFPTKAALFKEVVERISDTYYRAHITWLEGLEQLDPAHGLSLYIDRFLDFAVKHPQGLRIVALNMVQAQGREVIPGYQQVRDFFAKNRQAFKKAVPLKGPDRAIDMFTHSFNTLAINYLGAAPYYASLIGLSAGGRQYLKWVKETMMFMFLPQLKQIINTA